VIKRDICRKTVETEMAEILPQRKRSEEYNWKKKGYNQSRTRTHIHFGEAFQHWKLQRVGRPENGLIHW